MKVVAILQARMNSSRLPGKVLLPLAGKPMVQNIIERVQRATKLDEVVLAIPYTDKDLFGSYNNCSVMWTENLDENDLVSRYRITAEWKNADLIVRIPCDNPCVQPEMIDAAVETYLSTPQIYVSTMYWHLHDRVYVDGLGAEVFSVSRLQWLDQKTKGQPNYREHPHLFFQDHHLIDGWEQYQRYANQSETIRLDVNDQRDYAFIQDIYEHFGHNQFHVSDVLTYLQGKGMPACH